MKRKAKSQGEKERYKHLNAELQRTARRYKKAFVSDQCKQIGLTFKEGAAEGGSGNWGEVVTR